jgi:hypothetical protein
MYFGIFGTFAESSSGTIWNLRTIEESATLNVYQMRKHLESVFLDLDLIVPAKV